MPDETPTDPTPTEPTPTEPTPAEPVEVGPIRDYDVIPADPPPPSDVTPIYAPGERGGDGG